ncbi:MAG: DMT family transporter [Runella slithyformis]|nr:MAG: DMT family transporter [Runella slithyformis]TAF00212.1 MAG: DMT family transporter [Runella slithyformis]TAF27497.1 MAG: DMT family transporter [Runella slithyformis]TAF46226.1 MAG: DMT family transporter [Runella slithyformis]TAF80838.1 MAG: DMT family transporter [Runella slithyformis]
MRLTYTKLIATVFFWGSGFTAGKIAVQTLGPYSSAFVRFAVGTLVLLLVFLKTNRGFVALSRKQWVWAILSGVTGVFLYNVFIFKGLQHIPAVRAALITAFAPIVIALGSALFFNEKFTPLKWFGVLISLGGTLVVVTRGNLTAMLSNATWGIGEVLVVGCVFSWTTYTLIGKVALQQISALTLSTYSALIGTVLLFVLAWQEGVWGQLAQASWQSIGAAAYMGLTATALGYVWYYDAVRQIGPAKAAVVGNLSPVFAVLIAVVVLGEEITIATVLGGLLVLGGVWITNLK